MHFPKCAGTFMEKLLKKYYENDQSVKFDLTDPTDIIWHQNVIQREERMHVDLSGKSLICNFRRLPNWIVSRINYESARSAEIVPREMYVKGRFFEMSGNESFADKYVTRYTGRPVNHWIRVEHLEADFYNAFNPYLDVKAKVQSSDFKEKINVSKGVLNINQWFTDEELAILYRSSPKWAQLEMELYGDLLVEI